MAAHEGLPGEGPVQFGSVALPAGRLITAEYGSGEPVAWATGDPVPEPGQVWAALSAARDQTGLVPILLDGLHGGTSRPWDSGEFGDPEDPRRADALDPGALLEDCWNRRGWPDDDDLAAQPGCRWPARRRPGRDRLDGTCQPVRPTVAYPLRGAALMGRPVRCRAG